MREFFNHIFTNRQSFMIFSTIIAIIGFAIWWEVDPRAFGEFASNVFTIVVALVIFRIAIGYLLKGFTGGKGKH